MDAYKLPAYQRQTPIRNFHFWLGILAGCQEDNQSNTWACPVGGSSVRQQQKLVPAYFQLLPQPDYLVFQLPTYHCDMLQLPLVRGQRPRTLRRESQRRLLYRERAIRRWHVRWLYPVSGWTYNEFQGQPSSRHAQYVLNQPSCLLSPFVHSSLGTNLLCGSHSPPLLPWLLDCSVAFSLPLTSAIPPWLSSIMRAWIVTHHTSNSRGPHTVTQTKLLDGNVVVRPFSRSCVFVPSPGY
jgi:hypothetical protein